MSRGYVLVVDDDPLLAELAVAILEHHDYEAAVAEEGERALALIHKRIPDVILLDAGMPVLDGFEVLQSLNTHPALRRIPVIMVTARRAPKDVEKARQLGVFGYIAKPFAADHLLQRIAAAFQSPGRLRGPASPVSMTPPTAPKAGASLPDIEFLD